MPVMLKWKGDELFLGKTKMAEVRASTHGDHAVYVLGPEDKVSEPYESPEDARQDCETEVRRLLKAAGAEVSGG
jgi:hypothetical protein